MQLDSYDFLRNVVSNLTVLIMLKFNIKPVSIILCRVEIVFVIRVFNNDVHFAFFQLSSLSFEKFQFHHAKKCMKYPCYGISSECYAERNIQQCKSIQGNVNSRIQRNGEPQFTQDLA